MPFDADEDKAFLLRIFNLLAITMEDQLRHVCLNSMEDYMALIMSEEVVIP